MTPTTSAVTPVNIQTNRNIPTTELVVQIPAVDLAETSDAGGIARFRHAELRDDQRRDQPTDGREDVDIAGPDSIQRLLGPSRAAASKPSLFAARILKIRLKVEQENRASNTKANIAPKAAPKRLLIFKYPKTDRRKN